MPQPRRRGQRVIGRFFELPVLPFLSIMLGLMSVMALATMGISVEERQAAAADTEVELVGIPASFVPLQMRCMRTAILWRDTKDEWHEVTVYALLSLMQNPRATQLPRDALAFRSFLIARADENRRLSFERRQNTLILWVEPAGVYAQMMVGLIVSELQLPLRIGLLPILETEILNPDASP